MKKLQYLVFIGIFVMLSGMAAYAYASDDGSEANYISILKKQPKNHDGGSTVEPGDTENPGDQGEPSEVEEPDNDDPADPVVVNATVAIKPETINLKRHGIFAAIINLPETTDVGLIATDSIMLSIIDPTVIPVTGTDATNEVASAIGDFAPQAPAPFTLMTTTTVAPTRVFVVESTNSVIALFSNQGVVDLIKNNIDITKLPSMVTFEVQWKLTGSDTIYEASDEVRVINPGNGNVNGKGKGKGVGKGKGKGGGAE